MIRLALPDEFPLATGEVKFVFEENGSVKGYVCVSRIENKHGMECWIHDLAAEGQSAVVLMAKARSQAKEWGFKEVWANVGNPKLGFILRNNGWIFEQAIFKGAL
jgi:hypothetical protein